MCECYSMLGKIRLGLWMVGEGRDPWPKDCRNSALFWNLPPPRGTQSCPKFRILAGPTFPCFDIPSALVGHRTYTGVRGKRTKGVLGGSAVEWRQEGAGAERENVGGPTDDRNYVWVRCGGLIKSPSGRQPPILHANTYLHHVLPSLNSLPRVGLFRGIEVPESRSEREERKEGESLLPFASGTPLIFPTHSVLMALLSRRKIGLGWFPSRVLHPHLAWYILQESRLLHPTVLSFSKFSWFQFSLY